VIVLIFHHAVISTVLFLNCCLICDVDVKFPEVQKNRATAVLTDQAVLFLELCIIFLKLYPDLSLYTLPEGKNIRLIKYWNRR